MPATKSTRRKSPPRKATAKSTKSTKSRKSTNSIKSTESRDSAAPQDSLVIYVHGVAQTERPVELKLEWDLALFGHRGYLSFTGMAQPWLASAAKRWAGAQLPRHRGGGAARVRGKINGLGLLSEYLGCRPDRGLIPAILGRRDVAGGLGRDPRPGPDPTRGAGGRVGRRLRHRARRYPRRSRTRRARP